LAFEKKLAQKEAREPQESAGEIVEKRFDVLNAEDFEVLKERAALLDNSSEEERAAWRDSKLERIRLRGIAARFDENINPSHIVEVLSREPFAIQTLILRNLPSNLSRRLALYLDLKFSPEDGSLPADLNGEIVALVRQSFLSNFIALEQIYEPDELDKFSADEMERFIRHLGLREVAIACRGINSKETLAAFLNRFGEEDVREIALYITELDRIRPFWVAQADELVRRSWSPDLAPAKVIEKIGFSLLTTAFAVRDKTKCDYAAQKLSIREVGNWQKMIRLARKNYFSADEEEKMRLDKRRRIIERLAEKFSRTGRL
jgi:hypothetical protein